MNRKNIGLSTLGPKVALTYGDLRCHAVYLNMIFIENIFLFNLRVNKQEQGAVNISDKVAVKDLINV